MSSLLIPPPVFVNTTSSKYNLLAPPFDDLVVVIIIVIANVVVVAAVDPDFGKALNRWMDGRGTKDVVSRIGCDGVSYLHACRPSNVKFFSNVDQHLGADIFLSVVKNKCKYLQLSIL